MGQVGWRQVWGSLYGPAGQEALFLLPALPRKVFRGCPSTHQDPPSPSGHRLVLVLQGEGKHSRVEPEGPVTLLSVVCTSAEQPPRSPGQASWWEEQSLALGTACFQSVLGDKADGEGEAFLSATGRVRRGLALRVCILCPACFTPRVLAWL